MGWGTSVAQAHKAWAEIGVSTATKFIKYISRPAPFLGTINYPMIEKNVTRNKTYEKRRKEKRKLQNENGKKI